MPVENPNPQQPVNKTGRLDLLALDLLDFAVKKYAQNNPVVQSVHQTYRPLAEAVISEFLSPDVLASKFSGNRPKPRTTAKNRTSGRKPSRVNPANGRNMR
jgi:hypothetical protein